MADLGAKAAELQEQQTSLAQQVSYRACSSAFGTLHGALQHIQGKTLRPMQVHDARAAAKTAAESAAGLEESFLQERSLRRKVRRVGAVHLCWTACTCGLLPFSIATGNLRTQSGSWGACRSIKARLLLCRCGAAQVHEDLQQMRGAIRTLCRARPAQSDGDSVLAFPMAGALTVSPPDRALAAFEFNACFGPASTQVCTYLVMPCEAGGAGVQVGSLCLLQAVARQRVGPVRR